MAVNLQLLRPVFTTCNYVPVSQLLLHSTNPVKTPYRNTTILKRRVPIPPFPRHCDPEYIKRHVEPIHEEFLVEEETDANTAPLVELVLRKYVEDVGKPGQIVSLNPLQAYDLVILGEAYYATHEYVAKVKVLGDHEIEKYSSMTAYKTMKLMKKETYSIYVNMHEPWTIERWIVRVNLRIKGIQVLSDDCIELPEKPIKGPNMDIEGKDFAVFITINNCERFPIRCRLRHYTKIFNERVALTPDHEGIESEPILPEQAEILKSIPLPTYVETVLPS